MTIISKYVALKNYIPTGLPKEEDFEIIVIIIIYIFSLILANLLRNYLLCYLNLL